MLFTAVQHVGLPDVNSLYVRMFDLLTETKLFIFELTDLYDKKNIPKVIYCIHALA